MPIMINTIIFDIIFLDIDPALANAIIVFSMLLLILIFNKENIIEIFQVVINFPTTSKVPIKRRFLIIGMTIIVIALIFAFDSLI
tara:strand:+ start:471 stop:725 length:255 start_codon:yes stop_codon:yes gene_type:complete